MNIYEQIKNYQPYNKQEEKDKKLMLNCLENSENIFTRENTLAHFTASSWAVNKQRNKVVMIYHNIYQSWAWTGGHADGETDLLQVAIRELKEETGAVHVMPLQEEIFSLEVACVDGHIKKGEYVSSHIHLNVTYLLEVDENALLHKKEDENSGVKWIPIEEISTVVKEKWFKENIYSKLNEKLAKL